MPEIGQKEKKYLMQILTHPLRSIGWYSKAVGSSNAAMSIRKKLEAQSFIRTMKFNRAGIGSVVFPILTEKGLRAIGLEKEAKSRKGRGGPYHQCVAKAICEYLKSLGYSTRIEEEYEGKRTDIVSRKNGETLAVEIIVSDDKRRDRGTMHAASTRFDKVIFAVATAVQRDYLLSIKKEENFDNVEVVFLTACLPWKVN